MGNNIINYPMNKRGQIPELIGIVIIIGIAIYGASTVYSQKDLIYVGDTNNSIAYKYSDCKQIVSGIPKESMVVFATKADIPSTYKTSDCS